MKVYQSCSYVIEVVVTFCLFTSPFTQQAQQRWINVDSTSIFNVVSTLKLGWIWKLGKCCFDVVSTLYRRCFNVVSTLFQCRINVYPMFYQPSNKLLFWHIEYVFLLIIQETFFLLYSNYFGTIVLSLLLQYTLICSLVTNSMDSRIILVLSRIWCCQRPLVCDLSNLGNFL